MLSQIACKKLVRFWYSTEISVLQLHFSQLISCFSEAYLAVNDCQAGGNTLSISIMTITTSIHTVHHNTVQSKCFVCRPITLYIHTYDIYRVLRSRTNQKRWMALDRASYHHSMPQITVPQIRGLQRGGGYGVPAGPRGESAGTVTKPTG